MTTRSGREIFYCFIMCWTCFCKVFGTPRVKVTNAAKSVIKITKTQRIEVINKILLHRHDMWITAKYGPYFMLPPCGEWSESHLYACCFQALEIIDDVGDRLTLKYSRMQPPNITENDQDFVERWEECECKLQQSNLKGKNYEMLKLYMRRISKATHFNFPAEKHSIQPCINLI